MGLSMPTGEDHDIMMTQIARLTTTVSVCPLVVPSAFQKIYTRGAKNLLF